MSEAELLWALIGVLTAVAGLGVAIKKIFFSAPPQPFETREVEGLMSRRECNVMHGHFEVRLATLERRFDAHLVDVKDDIGGLHQKINDNHSEVMKAIVGLNRATGRMEGGQS